MTNGWRGGRDPAQRVLRILAVLVFLSAFVYLIVDPNRHVDSVPVTALVLGCVLVLLGYEGIVRLPYIGQRPDDKEDDE